MYTISLMTGAAVVAFACLVLAAIGVLVVVSQLSASGSFKFTAPRLKQLSTVVRLTLVSLKADLFGILITDKHISRHIVMNSGPMIIYMRPKISEVLGEPTLQDHRTTDHLFNESKTPCIHLVHDGRTQTIPLIKDDKGFQDVSAQSSLFNVPVVFFDMSNDPYFDRITSLDAMLDANSGAIVIVIYRFAGPLRMVIAFGKSELYTSL
jgi:hypothetical protein